MRTIVWFRGKDLRVSDHAPLAEAQRHGEVIPLFVLDPYFFAPERASRIPHRMQFLLDSLTELSNRLVALGSRLIVIRGRSVEVIPRIADAWKADHVFAHRWSEPFGRERDAKIAESLGSRFRLFEGETLHPPGTLRTQSDRPYSVFTPFSKRFHAEARIDQPIEVPTALPPLPPEVASDGDSLPSLAELGIARNPRLQDGGERAAAARLDAWVSGAGDAYAARRDRMAENGTSRLSADLKFGTLSARTVWVRARDGIRDADAREAFLRQLIWREFTHSTLWDRPDILSEPFRGDFRGFPWRRDRAAFLAWAEGRTGYPVVDAAARQLMSVGFVHNRARMIAASFLTKHLLTDYRWGEKHYLQWLTDGDWAQNNAGWQWTAGCGCDAQPYFRVFNPMSQGKKFDPTGEYVRRWVPELAGMPDRHIHAPWSAPSAVLEAAKVTLGETYPEPMIDHREGRQRFLDTASAFLRRARAEG